MTVERYGPPLAMGQDETGQPVEIRTCDECRMAVTLRKMMEHMDADAHDSWCRRVCHGMT